jgi:drug/metabolite transporter (DMT)-like permease
MPRSTSLSISDSDRPPRLPLLRLLGGSVCISFSPIFIKLADVSPDSAGFYRMLFAGGALALWILLGRMSWRMPRRPLLLLAAAGLFLGIDFMFWHRSIHLVGPGLSTLLGNFQVFFTALFSWLFLRQKITGPFMVAVMLALTGLLLITGVDLAGLDAGYRLGVLFGLGTAVFYSGYIMFLKQGMTHPELSGISAMLVVSLVCMTFMGSVTAATGASFRIPDAPSLLALIGVGVVSTTLGWSLISSAMRHVRATFASLVLLLQPTLSMIWDVLLFGRPTSGYEVLGIALILSGIFLGSYRRAYSTT